MKDLKQIYILLQIKLKVFNAIIDDIDNIIYVYNSIYITRCMYNTLYLYIIYTNKVYMVAYVTMQVNTNYLQHIIYKYLYRLYSISSQNVSFIMLRIRKLMILFIT